MTNRRNVFLLLLCIAVAACNGQKSDKAPIPMPKMEQVLLDIHLAEVYSGMLDTGINIRNEKNLDSLAVFYKDVFAHHKITEQQFSESMDWYKAHPAELDSCYKHITDKLIVMEGSDTSALKK